MILLSANGCPPQPRVPTADNLPAAARHASCARTSMIKLTAVVLALGALAGCASAPVRELTGAERIQLDQAEQRLIRTCMARQGFPYWVRAPLTADEQRVFGFVVDDVGWARRYGYGGLVQRQVLAQRAHDPNRIHRESLSPDARAKYTDALAGGPRTKPLTASLPAGGTVKTMIGGCEAEAQTGLYGDRAAWFRLDKVATNLQPLYVHDLISDSRFTTALKAWSRCMHGKGHRYSSPAEIRSALPGLTEGLDSAAFLAAEVRLAVPEAECARASGLADTARSLQQHYLGPYAADLAAHGRMELAALDRARKITH